jgi:hypothetical protein
MSPYIDPPSRRVVVDGSGPILRPGELNYQLALAIDQYLRTNKVSYNTLNDVMGVLTCLSHEVYRRIVAPYEDKKLKENGEVFITCMK